MICENRKRCRPAGHHRTNQLPLHSTRNSGPRPFAIACSHLARCRRMPKSSVTFESSLPRIPLQCHQHRRRLKQKPDSGGLANAGPFQFQDFARTPRGFDRGFFLISSRPKRRSPPERSRAAVSEPPAVTSERSKATQYQVANTGGSTGGCSSAESNTSRGVDPP
jgi:hypothetical protein